MANRVVRATHRPLNRHSKSGEASPLVGVVSRALSSSPSSSSSSISPSTSSKHNKKISDRLSAGSSERPGFGTRGGDFGGGARPSSSFS